MSRAALFIGIDRYPCAPLSGCEADAVALSGALARNEDESLNFECKVLVSSEQTIDKDILVQSINDVFNNKDAEIALFYFAGHGANTSNGGFLVTEDTSKYVPGVPMSQLIVAANQSPSRQRMIFLDCCHSGAIDDLFGSDASIGLAEGVSILAACRKDQSAVEKNGRGLFTSLVCDGLSGGAADVRGTITVAGLYAYVDQLLTIWQQRPLFKANLTKLVPIRRGAACIPDGQLRRIALHFPAEDHVLQLDPSYEPTEQPAHPDNEAVFRDLQKYRAAQLLVPNGAESLYDAAKERKSCGLTPMGKFYWRCVKAGKI